MKKRKPKWTETPTSWIDNISGLEWHKEGKAGISQYSAEEWAKDQGKRLPTKEEFEEAEKNGIRDLPNMEWKGHWFWSSTPYPAISVFAYELSGDNGGIYFGYRDGDSDSTAARCVSAPGVKRRTGMTSKLERLNLVVSLLQSIIKELEK